MKSGGTRIAPLGARFKAQLLGIVAFNGYFWAPGGKYVCLPVLNCYACPASTTACPIGSLSAFAAIRRAPYYLLGLLGVFGVAVGRTFCGWACPFGWLQDMFHRIPTRKWRMPRPINWVKYGLLVALVIAVPMFEGKREKDIAAADTVVKEGTGAHNFCSLVCPAGTLEASVPGLMYSATLRKNATWRTYSKMGSLVIFLGLMVVWRRSFCRGVCPLGALMALSGPVAALRLRTDPQKCTRCMRCVAVCPTDCRSVPETAGGKEATSECVLCLDCVRSCPEAGALSAQWGRRCVAMSKDRDNA
jgi:ferredoxin